MLSYTVTCTEDGMKSRPNFLKRKIKNWIILDIKLLEHQCGVDTRHVSYDDTSWVRNVQQWVYLYKMPNIPCSNLSLDLVC